MGTPGLWTDSNSTVKLLVKKKCLECFSEPQEMQFKINESFSRPNDTYIYGEKIVFKKNYMHIRMVKSTNNIGLELFQFFATNLKSI